LAEAGVRYVCDWTNDEQPFPMTTPTGELFALPLILDLDDVFALRDRRFPVDGYARNLKQAFDRIYRDSSRSGRLIVLTIHPYLMGQPFRIGYLDDALGHMVRRQKVWPATGGQIVDWYRQRCSEISAAKYSSGPLRRGDRKM